MQCINCGKKLDNETIICPKCGKTQPDAIPAKKTGKKIIFEQISLLFLVIGLCVVPLLIILTIVLSTVGIITDASITDVVFQIGKLSLLIASPPLIVSLIFYLLGK